MKAVKRIILFILFCLLIYFGFVFFNENREIKVFKEVKKACQNVLERASEKIEKKNISIEYVLVANKKLKKSIEKDKQDLKFEIEKIRNKKVYIEEYLDVQDAIIAKLKEDMFYNIVKNANDDNALKVSRGQIDLIFIRKIIDTHTRENDPIYMKNTEVLKEYTIKIKEKDEKLNVEQDKNLNILISGLDTSGEISTYSRSDVNIILTIDKKNKKLLLTSIPRDTYLKLNQAKKYDKLTHAGIYGQKEQMKSLEDLLKIQIPYYIVFNFTTFEKIIDAMGGIEINSDREFVTILEKVKIKKGINKLNAKQALDYVRERHSFIDGDNQRGKNQEILIESVLKKIQNKEINIFNYISLTYNSLKYIRTNMQYKDIIKIVKDYLLNKNWKMEKQYLKGIGSLDNTYSIIRKNVYVMIPYKRSIKQIREKILGI